MNKEVAKVILATFSDANYLDRTSGVVQVFQRVVEVEEGVSVVKRIPYSDSATYQETALMSKAMIPNSNFKSCLYFEDFGITPAGFNVSRSGFLSRLRVVCWLNMDRIAGAHNTAFAAAIQGDLMKRIKSVMNYSNGTFYRMTAKIAGIPVQSDAIFANYDYDQAATQYLFPPYDYFAIDIETTFEVADKCIESFVDQIVND
jgi:hypothetical protein